MSGCELYIKHLNDVLPMMATTRDLVDVGLFSSLQSAYEARRNGTCPEYLKFNSKKAFYPKQSVIDFVRSKIVKTCAS